MRKRDAYSSIKIRTGGKKAKAYWVNKGSGNNVEISMEKGVVQESETDNTVETTKSLF